MTCSSRPPGSDRWPAPGRRPRREPRRRDRPGAAVRAVVLRRRRDRRARRLVRPHRLATTCVRRPSGCSSSRPSSACCRSAGSPRTGSWPRRRSPPPRRSPLVWDPHRGAGCRWSSASPPWRRRWPPRSAGRWRRGPRRRCASGSSPAPAIFVATGLCALGGAAPPFVWSLLLVGALLAARFVPGLAVDVPDQYLIDLERLAVTAWSAREQPSGKRGRSVVPIDAIGAGRDPRHPAGHRRLHGGPRRGRAQCAAAAEHGYLADRPDRRALPGRLRRRRAAASRPAATGTPRPGCCCAPPGLGCWAALLVVLLDATPGRRRSAGWSSGRSALALVLAGRGRRGRPGLALRVVVAPGRGGRGAQRRARARVAGRRGRLVPPAVGAGEPVGSQLLEV